MITSQDSMLQAAKLSLFTPFKLLEELESIQEDESLELLKQATDAALQLVEAPKILKSVKGESDLLLIFDCLMQDYIHEHMNYDVEQFRAIVFKNYLIRLQLEQSEDSSETATVDSSETPEVEVFENVCTKLFSLIQTSNMSANR